MIFIQVMTDDNLQHIKKTLPRVESSEIFDKDGNYHPKGLFSEVIFGPTRDYQCQCGKYKGIQYEGVRCEECKVLVTSSKLRRYQYAYIQLHSPIYNPQLIYRLLQVKPSMKKKLLRIKDPNIMNEIEETLETIKSKDISELRTKTEIELKTLMDVGVYKTDVVLVTPPDLRPFSKTKSNIDNDENHLFQLILGYNEKYNDIILNTEIDTLYRFIMTRETYKLYLLFKNHVSGKSGLPRTALLGKENDFSARTVITPDPLLDIDEISVPYLILAEILRPFIINRLSYKITHLYAYEILDKYIKYPHKLDKKDINMIESAIDEIISEPDFSLIINRQPTLHRPSMRSYKVKANKHKSLQVNPLVLIKFGGDFDGDQMAIYLPLTEEAKVDSINKLFEDKNMLEPGGLGYHEISQNIVMGIYKLTKDKPKSKPKYKFEDVISAITFISSKELDAGTTIKIGDVKTTVGRLLVSTILVDDISKMKLDDIINKPIDKKKLNKIIEEKIHRSMLGDLDINRVKEIIRNISTVGTYASNDATISIEDFILDKEFKLKINKKLKELSTMFKNNPNSIVMNVKKTNDTLKELSNELANYLPENLDIMIKSGAKGNLKQMAQVFIAKGFVSDIEGNIVKIPILRPLIDGITEEQFLLMSMASRKGSADRSLRTADPGYMTRKLVYSLNRIELSNNDFCGTDKLLKVNVTKSNYRRFIYRYINDNGTKVLLTNDNIEDYIGKTINLYSPIFCKDKHGVCKTCYGEYNKFLNSRYVGLIAAQSLGERTTQLTMRTFHVGASAELGNIEIPYDYFEEENKIVYTTSDINIYIKSINMDQSNKLLTPMECYILKDDGRILVRLPIGTKILNESIINSEHGSTIQIKSGEQICELPDSSKDIVNAVQYLLHIIENKTSHPIEELDKEIKNLYDELDMIFGDLGILSIWYEILISEMLYCKSNPDKLIRYANNDEIMDGFIIESIVNIPHKRLILGIGFQNIDKAMRNLILNMYRNSTSIIKLDEFTIMERIMLQNV